MPAAAATIGHAADFSARLAFSMPNADIGTATGDAEVVIDVGARSCQRRMGVNWLPEPSLSVFLHGWLERAAIEGIWWAQQPRRRLLGRVWRPGQSASQDRLQPDAGFGDKTAQPLKTARSVDPGWESRGKWQPHWLLAGHPFCQPGNICSGVFGRNQPLLPDPAAWRNIASPQEHQPAATVREHLAAQIPSASAGATHERALAQHKPIHPLFVNLGHQVFLRRCGRRRSACPYVMSACCWPQSPRSTPAGRRM